MNKIRQLRQKAAISQTALADRLGVSQQTISQWENNITDPVAKKIPELADVLGCSINELFEEA